MSARILAVHRGTPGFERLITKLDAEYYDVRTVPDAEAAVRWLQADPSPDLVILEATTIDPLGGPVGGPAGFARCRRLKSLARGRELPVLMVAAASDAEGTRAPDRQCGLAAGAEDFLITPAHDAILLARIRSLVRRKRTMDQWQLREETSQLLALWADVSPGPSAAGDHARILLVDQRTDHAHRLHTALSAAGNTVIIASSSRTALAWISEVDCDAVVIDISIANDDPLRLCSRIRLATRHPQLPILLVADGGDDRRLAKALDLGIDDYVLRPVDPAELGTRIAARVRHSRYQEWLRANYHNSLRMALTDSLTGLYNRRYLHRHLDTMMRRLPVTGATLSALMIDIDHFKTVNDRHGHGAGDDVLREVARRIVRHLRAADMAARYGGEEFVVIMPDCPSDIAVDVAERLRRAVAESPITRDNVTIRVTISIGVASTSGITSDTECLLRAADDALYRAKRTGRDRVVASATLMTTTVMPAPLMPAPVMTSP
ncbi:MAG: diguanylate cyclase [Azospirillaceae bacterium]|nr:diguanylate cyclase [Azospirillaceae bacterium]